MDRLTERAVGRCRCEGHALPRTSDSHPAVVQGHSSREDRKIRERARKCADQCPGVEMPLEEKDDVDRQVRNHGIADVATDFEPFCVQWSDQLGRHCELPSPVHDDEAAEFRGVGDSAEMHLLIGGRVGLDPEILQHRPQHDVHLGGDELGAEAPS